MSYYAVLGAGKTAVPVNFLLAPADVKHIVADADLDTVITTGVLAEPLRGLFANVVLIEDHMGALTSAAAKRSLRFTLRTSNSARRSTSRRWPASRLVLSVLVRIYQ